jgi:hypothetical protein
MKVVLDSLADDIRREEDSEVQPSRGSDGLFILRGTGFLPRQVFQTPPTPWTVVESREMAYWGTYGAVICWPWRAIPASRSDRPTSSNLLHRYRNQSPVHLFRYFNIGLQ